MLNPFNSVHLTGRFVADPELRTTPSEKEVTNFSLVPLNTRKDEKVDYINCVAWGNTAKAICEYFEKGKPISLVGHLASSNYENKEGNKTYRMDVVIESWGFLPPDRTNNE